MIGGNFLSSNRRSRLLTLHGFGEIRKELIGQFLGRAVDQALTELCQFAADLGFDGIAKQGTAILRLELDRRPALGEARDPAVALPGTSPPMRITASWFGSHRPTEYKYAAL